MNTSFTITEISRILPAYNIGKLVNSTVITNGSVQSNILLKVINKKQAEKKFVFRYYRQGRRLESVKFEVNLSNYLIKNHYPCPAPVKKNDGSFIGIYNNKPYVIFEFMEGEHIEQPTLRQKKELIKKVAELQILTQNYKPSYRKCRLNYDIASCRKLAVEKAEQLNNQNAFEKLNWLKNELSKLYLPKTLPKGICHCDFHFTNVLFHDGKFNALIDFDDANYTYLMFDLVWLINPFKKEFDWNTWQKFKHDDHIFDFGEASFIVSEYNKYRSLNPNEKHHFYDLFKLSVLIDCIWYFDRGDVSDFFEKRKIEALNKLGRENFINKIFF